MKLCNQKSNKIQKVWVRYVLWVYVCDAQGSVVVCRPVLSVLGRCRGCLSRVKVHGRTDLHRDRKERRGLCGITWRRSE